MHIKNVTIEIAIRKQLSNNYLKFYVSENLFTVQNELGLFLTEHLTAKTYIFANCYKPIIANKLL